MSFKGEALPASTFSPEPRTLPALRAPNCSKRQDRLALEGWELGLHLAVPNAQSPSLLSRRLRSALFLPPNSLLP